jgi:DNA primase
MTAIDEIKAKINIEDLVSESVQLRKTGKNLTGFCPFHSNTRTPAFVVFPETGTWRCFGQCNEGGDIFGFVMKREGWDFSEALRYLAERAGVELRPPTPEEMEAAEEHDNLRAMLEEAVAFYRHNLLNTEAGRVAYDYLREKRALSDETIEAFGLGYAPNSWEATITHFKAKGYDEQDLIASGLVTERDSGGIYDRFRHRVLFPIRDGRGRMAGFGARILNPDDVPKFLNSPQTDIFDKGHLLYGLDRARKAIRTEDQVIIVEGYLDVIALHQAGYQNVVSPMGTALTETQLRLVKRYTRRIVLALDPDAAGDQATLRGLQVARQALDRETDPVFDARGLLGHEARLKADIRVTTLPEGMDPDDVVNRDPDEWERILAEAKPIVVHVMETLAAGRDLEDAKVKSDISAQVLPLIEDVPDPVERDTYRQGLARLLKVDERVLVGTAGTRRRPRRQPRAPIPMAEELEPQDREAVATSDTMTSRMTLEAHCLGILMRRPDLVHWVDRQLQEHGLARLSRQDFHSTDHQLVLRLIEESLRQDHAEPLRFVLNNLPMPVMVLVDGMLEMTKDLNPENERVLEDLVRVVLVLRRRHLNEHMDHVRFLMQEVQEAGDIRATDYLQAMKQGIETRELLDRALGYYTNRALQ